MELSEPVVVSVGTRHRWYLNAMMSTPLKSPGSWREHRRYAHNWWRNHYGAHFTDNYELVFPDQETYVQCVLTWS
jgi:hypothetical protein